MRLYRSVQDVLIVFIDQQFLAFASGFWFLRQLVVIAESKPLIIHVVACIATALTPTQHPL